MKKRHWSDDIPVGICPPAREWLNTQKSVEEAWRNCEEPHWMLWFIKEIEMYWSGRTSIDWWVVFGVIFSMETVYLSVRDRFDDAGVTADHVRLVFPYPPRFK